MPLMLLLRASISLFPLLLRQQIDTRTGSVYIDISRLLTINLVMQMTPWEIDDDSLLGYQSPHESLPWLLPQTTALPLEGNLRHLSRKKSLGQCSFE